MQIRIRKNRLELLRTRYDKDKKRSTQSIIATMPAYAPAINEQLKATLTDSELEQFNRYISVKEAASKEQTERYKVRTAEKKLLELADAVKKYGHDLSDEERLKISKALTTVRRAVNDLPRTPEK